MKLLAVLILSMASCAALAADRDVRIFAPSNKVRVTGDRIPKEELAVILFTREPCPLNIPDKRNTYRAWHRTGRDQLGCWYPTTDQGYVFVTRIESESSKSSAFWATYPRAKLHDDGSATITQANYNSETFLKNFLAERMNHMFDHVHDKP